MVFQLPVMAFPESPRIHNMRDYEHLRLFLHTTSLRYSYGQVKGRTDANWQRDVAALPRPDMVAALERYGFAALLINRNAYEDRAGELAGDLAAVGLPVLVDLGDFVVFRLTPPDAPELPPH
jgi:phosphoglycerol transferase